MESDSIRVRRRATHYPIIPKIQGRYREYDFERTKRELSKRNPIMKRISIQPRNTLWFTALTKAQNTFKDLKYFTTHQNSKLRVIITWCVWIKWWKRLSPTIVSTTCVNNSNVAWCKNDAKIINLWNLWCLYYMLICFELNKLLVFDQRSICSILRRGKLALQ